MTGRAEFNPNNDAVKPIRTEGPAQSGFHRQVSELMDNHSSEAFKAGLPSDSFMKKTFGDVSLFHQGPKAKLEGTQAGQEAPQMRAQHDGQIKSVNSDNVHSPLAKVAHPENKQIASRDLNRAEGAGRIQHAGEPRPGENHILGQIAHAHTEGGHVEQQQIKERRIETSIKRQYGHDQVQHAYKEGSSRIEAHKHREAAHAGHNQVEHKHPEATHAGHNQVEHKHPEATHAGHDQMEHKHPEATHVGHNQVEHKHPEATHAGHNQVEHKHPEATHVGHNQVEHKHPEATHAGHNQVEHKHPEATHAGHNQVEHKHPEATHAGSKQTEPKHAESKDAEKVRHKGEQPKHVQVEHKGPEQGDVGQRGKVHEHQVHGKSNAETDKGNKAEHDAQSHIGKRAGRTEKVEKPSERMPESKAERKMENKPESKAETRVESRSESRLENKSENKPMEKKADKNNVQSGLNSKDNEFPAKPHLSTERGNDDEKITANNKPNEIDDKNDNHVFDQLLSQRKQFDEAPASVNSNLNANVVDTVQSVAHHQTVQSNEHARTNSDNVHSNNTSSHSVNHTFALEHKIGKMHWSAIPTDTEGLTNHNVNTTSAAINPMVAHSGQSGNSGHSGHNGSIGSNAHSGNIGHTGHAGHSAQSGHSGHTGHSGHNGQNTQSGQQGHNQTGHSDPINGQKQNQTNADPNNPTNQSSNLPCNQSGQSTQDAQNSSQTNSGQNGQTGTTNNQNPDPNNSGQANNGSGQWLPDPQMPCSGQGGHLSPSQNIVGLISSLVAGITHVPYALGNEEIFLWWGGTQTSNNHGPLNQGFGHIIPNTDPTQAGTIIHDIGGTSDYNPSPSLPQNDFYPPVVNPTPIELPPNVVPVVNQFGGGISISTIGDVLTSVAGSTSNGTSGGLNNSSSGGGVNALGNELNNGLNNGSSSIANGSGTAGGAESGAGINSSNGLSSGGNQFLNGAVEYWADQYTALNNTGLNANYPNNFNNSYNGGNPASGQYDPTANLGGADHSAKHGQIHGNSGPSANQEHELSNHGKNSATETKASEPNHSHVGRPEIADPWLNPDRVNISQDKKESNEIQSRFDLLTGLWQEPKHDQKHSKGHGQNDQLDANDSNGRQLIKNGSLIGQLITLLDNEQKNKKIKKQNQQSKTYTVQMGDTLESIAHKMLGNPQLGLLLYIVNKAILIGQEGVNWQQHKLRPGIVLVIPEESEVHSFRLALKASKGVSNSQQFNKALDNELIERRSNIERLLGKLSTNVEETQSKQITTRLGDTLRSIALKHPDLNDVFLWKLLAQCNGLSIEVDDKGTPIAVLHRGMTLRIPTAEEVIAYRSEQAASVRNSNPKKALKMEVLQKTT